MPERFTASVAGKHMACSASANLELAIPNWRDPDPIIGGAADQGTEAHLVFEKLMGYTPSEIRHWITVLEYIENLRKGRRFTVLREQKVKPTWLDPAVGFETTVDLVLFTQDELHVIDLKWGKIPVLVDGNVQLRYYGACFAGLAPKAQGLTLHILQPRANNMDSEWVSATEMQQFMDDARAAYAKTQAKDLTFGPSDYCTFCPAYPHTRGAKGGPLCPATMQILYPQPYNEDDILSL